nr:PREDICTED: speriolin-like protein [Paralichthys olivaceus]
MDLEQTANLLLSKKEQLLQENEQLKSLLSVVKENVDLRARMQSFNNDNLEASSVCFLPGRNPSTLLKTTLDERQFRKDLDQTKLQQERRTLSPTDFWSFIQNSAHADTCERSHSGQADVALEGNARILGEIVLQLDRRILSHVFQGHRRLYGFTVQNIPDKIIEVSTNPLMGKVDKGYQRHLTQRYDDLMEQLNQLGYKKTLHPQFSEFIINTYGILKGRSREFRTQQVGYNNPETLKMLIMTTAPIKLQENLQLLLKCLCNMAKNDKKPLLLW